VYLRRGGFKVTRGNLADGDRGIAQTLDIMRGLIHKGSRELEVRAAAIDAIRGVRPHDHRGEVNALFRFVRDRIHFVNDVAGVETLQGPRATLSIGAGDCDDKATLLASLLGAVGISSSLRVVAANRRAPGRFSHVYVVAHVGGRNIPLDPTYARTPPGWQVPGALRRAEVAV
jgi:transglutaminase-like putative cysteine protease